MSTTDVAHDATLFQRLWTRLESSLASGCPREHHKAAEMMEQMAAKLRRDTQEQLKLTEVTSTSFGTLHAVENDPKHLRVSWPTPSIKENKAAFEDWTKVQSDCTGNTCHTWCPMYVSDGDGSNIVLIGLFLETMPGYALANSETTVKIVCGKRNGQMRYEIRAMDRRHVDEDLVVGSMDPQFG